MVKKMKYNEYKNWIRIVVKDVSQSRERMIWRATLDEDSWIALGGGGNRVYYFKNEIDAITFKLKFTYENIQSRLW